MTDPSSRYTLVLRQQPKQSRMCGVGEKADRRPIDPPPIIQARIDAGSSDCTSFLQNPYFFMYASLVPPDSDDELHLLRDGKTRSTTGSVVSSLYHLKDVDNSDAGFFVFPDLSVRMEGSYRLKMSLFEIVGLDVHYCASVFTDVFTVYSAKRFPGMEESTFLSRSFADQGLKIRIRKEIRARTHQRKQLRASTDAEPSSSGIKRMRLDSLDDSSSMVGSDEVSDSESKEDATDLPSGVVGPPTVIEPASQHRLYDIRASDQPSRPRAATHVFPNRPSPMEEYRSRSHSFGYEPRYSAPLHHVPLQPSEATSTYQFTPQSDLAKYSVNGNKQQRQEQQRPEHQLASAAQRLPPIASLAPPITSLAPQIPSLGAYPPPPPGAYYYPPPPGYYPPPYYYPYHPPQ